MQIYLLSFCFRLVYHGPTNASFPLLLCSDWTWVDSSPTLSHLDLRAVTENPCYWTGTTTCWLHCLALTSQSLTVVDLAHSHTTCPNLAEVQLSSHFPKPQVCTKFVCKLILTEKVFWTLGEMLVHPNCNKIAENLGQSVIAALRQ